VSRKDPEQFLRADHLKDDLKLRSLRGGSATMIGQGMKFVLQTTSALVLARLLLPEDFGLVAMVMAITRFAQQFRDFGLSAATIQKEEITHPQVSTLFWFNAGLSACITLLAMGLSPLIATFYGDGRLTWIAVVLSLMFLLSGLAVQHQALLRRQMRFRALMIVDIVAQLFGFAVAVVGAMIGMRHWALVVAKLAAPLAILVGVWTACGWRPGAPRRGTGVRPLLAFGGNLTGFNVINYFARNLDKILIGRAFGSIVLGIYDKAYSLLMMPIANIRGPVNAVSIPALSRLQDDPQRYRRYYCKVMTLIAFLSMPLMAFCFVVADDLVRVLLGPNWIGVEDYLRILALAGFIQPVIFTNGSVYVSMGQTDRMLRWGVWNSIATMAGFVAGMPWGAMGMAVGYTVVNYAMLWPTLWHMCRRSAVRAGDFVESVWRPATASLVSASIVFLLRPVLPEPTAYTPFLIGTGLFPIFYLLAWAVLPGGRAHLRELIDYVNIVLARSTVPAGARSTSAR
jgi:O-antigen/teichoic acid export membrane protein